MEAIREHEQQLVHSIIHKLRDKERGKKNSPVEVIGPMTEKNRVAVFSFVLANTTNFNNIGETFSDHNIAIRCGGHCAYPLHKHLKKTGTCRMSAYIYNDEDDITAFFETLAKIV